MEKEFDYPPYEPNNNGDDTVRSFFEERFGEEGKWLAGKLQGSLPVISLPDQTSILTAFNNDVDAAAGYAQLVYGFAKPGDVFMGLSTSGNSKNVVNAIRVAKSLGVKTIAMTGEGGGKLSELATVIIKAPSNETYKIQEYHLPVYHYLCAATEAYFFEK